MLGETKDQYRQVQYCGPFNPYFLSPANTCDQRRCPSWLVQGIWLGFVHYLWQRLTTHGINTILCSHFYDPFLSSPTLPIPIPSLHICRTRQVSALLSTEQAHEYEQSTVSVCAFPKNTHEQSPHVPCSIQCRSLRHTSTEAPQGQVRVSGRPAGTQGGRQAAAPFTWPMAPLSVLVAQVIGSRRPL